MAFRQAQQRRKEWRERMSSQPASTASSRRRCPAPQPKPSHGQRPAEEDVQDSASAPTNPPALAGGAAEAEGAGGAEVVQNAPRAGVDRTPSKSQRRQDAEDLEVHGVEER